MKKRIFLSIAAMAAIAAGVVGMSAFEAHVINVTARIEHALKADTTSIEFGTVFPEEVLYEPLDIQLSDSFVNESRVDSVNYVIRQKPKCALFDNNQIIDYGRVTEDESGNYLCADDSYVMLPILCPFLSKHADSDPANDESIEAFHGPLGDWTLIDTINTQVKGRLSKLENDYDDLWKIDLTAPCFSGQCAQDNFVPKEYQLDQSLEHEIFGCDLWVEVTGIDEEENPIDPREQACIEAGGTVQTSLCCLATGDFPDLCSTGACGCAPDNSHEVKICDCPGDACWNGQTCDSSKTISFNDFGTSPQYGYDINYGNANVSFIYNSPVNGNLTGTIIGSGLKPYATYQLKFEGKPICDYGAAGNDAINSYLGSIGRTWNNGSCVHGYLVWGYVTADGSGNINKAVTVNNSYHVLWCDSSKSCGNINSNNDLNYPDSSHSGVAFCPAASVYGQAEHGTCDATSLNAGDYDLSFYLTEEDFHQAMLWPTVMGANIQFTIN